MSEQEGKAPTKGAISNNKLDYLQAKYIFRFPFTFTAMKWGFVMGSFFGVHTFIRTREMRSGFRSWIVMTTVLSFATWMFYMIKYNYYQSNIQAYEQDQVNSGKEVELFRMIFERRLGLSAGHNLDDEEVARRADRMLKDRSMRHAKMDYLLEPVNQHTFNLSL